MGEDGKVVYKIEGDNSQALKALDEFEKEAKKTGGQFEGTVEETMNGAESTVSTTAAKIAKAIGSAFATKQIIEFGKAAIGVASDLNEVQNVVDTTFGNEGAIRINEWARNAAEAFGESELQAKQFTSTLGAMFKSMGVGQADMEEMSMSLAGLAGDMASFYNLDPTEAFEKLRSGISGETEPLKQLGINMSVANLEAFALSEGITTAYNSMTQAEQATLRYQYIMSATADAQGDFANTSDSLANQQRILQLEIQTLAAEIGQDLMPVAQEILTIARDGIEWIRENKDALEGLATAAGVAATAYGVWKATLKAEELYDASVKGIKNMTAALSGAEAAGGLTTALSGAETAASGMGTTMLGALGPAGWVTIGVVAGIGAIIAITYELQKAQEEALAAQYEYMDSLTSLADYKANGLVSVDGTIDYAAAKKMQEAGTFKKADKKQLSDGNGRNTYVMLDGGVVSTERYKQDQENSPLLNALGLRNRYWGVNDIGRHQSGEDFVMADWTPAYLDYGERVLTASENAKYTAMGGVDGMEQRMTSGGSGGGFSAPSKMELGLKVSPREMAHAITPYIIKELQAQGQWEDVR